MNRFKKRSSTLLPPRAQQLEPHIDASPSEKVAKPGVLNRLRDIVRKRDKDIAAPTTTGGDACTVTESLLDSSISEM